MAGLAGEVTRAGRSHLAATLARGLVAVWVEAVGDVTAAGAARGVSPPPPRAWLCLPGTLGLALGHHVRVPAQCHLYTHMAPCTPTLSLAHPRGHLYLHSTTCIHTVPLPPPLCHLYMHSTTFYPQSPLHTHHSSCTATVPFPASPCRLHTHHISCTHTIPLAHSPCPICPPSSHPILAPGVPCSATPFPPRVPRAPRHMHVPHSVTNRCWQRAPKVPGGQ